MVAQDLRDNLSRDPFCPFRVLTTAGEAYTVRDPHGAALLTRRLFVALPDDRWVLVPYLHISAIEAADAQ